MADTKKAIAKHELINAQGAVVETEEEATGVRYSLLAGGDPLDWQSGLPAGESKTMVWCFGAKTLLTNETSQSRQKGRTSIDEQLTDASERIKMIEGGKWVDRTREGFKPDPVILVNAFANTVIAEGKVTREQVDGGKFAEWTQKAAENAQWVRDVYALPAVKAEYGKLAGRPIKTVDSLI